MVVTRSQIDAAEMEERRRQAQEEEARRENERIRIEAERQRRLSLDPPASPGMLQGSTVREVIASAPTATTIVPGTSTDLPTFEARHRSKSPAHSVCSHRSNTSITSRMRLAELEAAKKMADIKRRELQIEADLVQKQLAAEVSAIQDDVPHEDPNRQRRVDEWLNTNPAETRGELGGAHDRTYDRDAGRRRERSTTPTRRNAIEQLAETIEKMARPRLRYAELPTFSGSPNEWLSFRAAMQDSTRMYNVSTAENLQRLRVCLKGEAKEAVSALLYTATDPNLIMKTLEQCFGRPELIVDRALDELKRLPKVGPSATDLNSFAIKLQNVTCVLKTINRKGYLYNPMLTREVLDKLSPHLKSRWCDYADDHEGTEDPEIVVLSRFLVREADRALKYAYAPTASSTNITAAKRETKPIAIGKRKAVAVYSVTNETNEHSEQTPKCPKCEQTHTLVQCPEYKTLTVEQRWDLVREKGLCFKCVQKRHRRVNCRAKVCGVKQCRRPHHATLHQDNVVRPAVQPTENKDSEAVLSIATRDSNNTRAVLLKMCPVTVVGPRGEENTYALFDEGATITLIDEELAQKIGAEGIPQPLNLRGVNMAQQERDSKLVTVRVRGQRDDDLHKLQARTVRNLNLHKQAIPNAVLKQDHLRDLRPDEVCYDVARPGVLIGADHWQYIVSRELRVGGPNQPAASRTQLGWVIHGTTPRSLIRTEESILHVYVPDRRVAGKEDRERDLHELVEAHFKIDALGVAHKPRVKDTDRRATNIVEKTIKKIDRGYEVGLPWVRDDVTMPPSYDVALRRLRSIERKMDASTEFAEAYTAQVENLLTKEYAVPCDGTESVSAVCWYLPHFAVWNPNKPGKPRLVFDAAAKSHGVSLNDKLLEGPDLLLSLPGIIFRFRERRIAISADIQEMFLRIKIRPEDQPAQQFLWRGSDRANAPRHYKMTSLIFGATSSPFMAHYVRDYNARAHAEAYPRALEAITGNHYMDDLVASYDDEEETKRVIMETITVHKDAGFTLRAWNASHKSVLDDVPTELHATTPTQLGGEGPVNKILGLYWNAEKDELGFNTSMKRVPEEVRTQRRPPTKREALSAVMSIYDPLGLVSHYTIGAKIMLQSLWRLTLSWDEPIPEEENETFVAWLRQLREIAQLRLQRCYVLTNCERIELHVLCDASEQAYATVAYWRIISRNKNISVVLVAAKAKVAPRRVQTIPRLELQAAVIGARLADTIKKEHRVEVASTTYWTDSSTVVHWIRHDTRRYTPFVAHRLGEIGELTNKEEWRWLPGDENVADDATRTTHAPISASDRWFRGPEFLYEPEDAWPTEKTLTVSDEDVILHTTHDDSQRKDWLPDVTRFSKYETLVRAAARVLAFVDRCRRRTTRLENKHIEQAEIALIQRAQRDSFAEEIKRLKLGHSIHKGSRIYRLDPVLIEGILRVRGRIQKANAPQETKQPVILDGRHPLTKLIVLREHCAAGHANRERVTNDLRQRYWVVHLRPTVRATERGCALCRVRRARPRTPTTGDLPRARLDPFFRPFTNCGVDYFGPMNVKVGRRHEKRWGALFTCLTSRAVHLELVASLSTDSAIMALRRMAARRGWPRTMYSDNATNFRGADKELQAAYAEWAPALRDEGLLHRMEWRYIPPGAANQGGAWERLVRSVKTALAATLKERAPAEEILKTLLTEAEFSINARPLTHVSVSPNDPEALTPNHFLLGTSLGLPITGPCDEADRRAWRASQALADHFWRRWMREYLPTLVPRGEPTDHKRRLRVGDIVIVADHSLPRNVWPMGIVERCYEGPDGGVRVADVRTKTGVFKRPVSKLVVLRTEEATRATPGGEC